MKIMVGDGDEDRIIVASSDHDPSRALEAHGFDPEEANWSVEHDPKSRIELLEEAVAASEKGPTKGIAHRIDDLEDRIESLEDETD